MDKPKCKYCGKEMTKVLMPPESDWGVDYFWVCMEDDCKYFVEGWDWMKTKFKVKASYRYKINPYNGEGAPIPVKDPSDMKDWIVKKIDVK